MANWVFSLYSSFKKRLVWLVIILGLAVRIPLVPTPLTYLSDVWREADTASIAHHFWENGFQILYPQIFWGGSGPGYVETEFQLYPFMVALVYSAFGEQLWLGRLVSLFITIPTLILFYLFARRLLGPQVALWSLTFIAISPLLIRYSVAFMPEATVLCFYVGALLLFQKWLDDQRLVKLVLASASTALAILVKPTAIHIGLIFALLAFQRHGGSVLRKREIWLAAAISLLPGILWYWHARSLYLEYGNTFGLFSGGDSKFGSFDYWLSPSFYLSLAELETMWVFAGVAAPVFVIGLVLALKRRQHMLLFGAVTIALYYFIVARYAREEWGIQYHIYAVPFAALGVGIGFDWLVHRQPKIIWLPIASLLLVLIMAGSGYLYQGMLRVTDTPLIQCAAIVADSVPEEARIIVSTTSFAITPDGTPNNYQEPQIFYYSHRYGWSLPADWHNPEKIREFQRAGAEYFVIYSKDLYASDLDLARYLETNARQIGPGVAQGCGIYEFSRTKEERSAGVWRTKM